MREKARTRQGRSRVACAYPSGAADRVPSMSSPRVRLVIILSVVTVAAYAVFASGLWLSKEHPTLAGLETLEWEDVKSRLASGEWVLVDARSERKFANGHLPGAYSLPADAPAEYLSFAVAEWPQDSVVVVYCGSPTCSLAAELANRLQNEAGVRDVRVLVGNYFKHLYRGE